MKNLNEKIKEASRKYYDKIMFEKTKSPSVDTAFIAGANWMKSKLYTEEEVKNICLNLLEDFTNPEYLKVVKTDFPNWFNQNKK